MNRWSSSFRLSLVLAFAMIAISCSKDEAQPPAEATVQESPVTDDAPEASGEEPPSDEFTLTPESPLSTDLANAYRETCIDRDGDEFDCEVFHSLVATELTMALGTIERSSDQRGAKVALDALDLDQEPQVLVAAMRILGRFPDTPGIAEKVQLLLLESPWIAVQDMAANLLAENPDPHVANLGQLWRGNHSMLTSGSEYDEYPDFPEHYAGMGFPEYPDAEWFSPLDSDRSIGWWTADDPAKVAAWMSEKLGVEAVPYLQWVEQQNAQDTAVFGNFDQAKMQEMEKLTEEYVQSQNPALLEKLQKLQQEIYAPVQDAAKAMELRLNEVAWPPHESVADQVQYFTAEERDGREARVVLIYRLTGSGRTVIQHAWDLGDYPSAWPPDEDES